MALRIPPLPNRPLEVRANGIWDPVRKTFYPFRVYTALTAVAKAGVRYYIHSVIATVRREGIQVSVSCIVNAVVGGNVSPIVFGYMPAQTQATDYNQVNVNVVDLRILTDPGTAITLTGFENHRLLMAEIPDDAAGDL